MSLLRSQEHYSLRHYMPTSLKARSRRLVMVSVLPAWGPLVCQSITATGFPWYRFYYGSLVLSILNITFLFLTFKPTSGERIREHQKALSDSRRQNLSNLLHVGLSSPTRNGRYPATSEATLSLDVKPRSMLRLALAIPFQWAVSFFILLYCGSETLTGFMITLLSTRHVNPKTIGYVTSGFWCGISLGRFIWGYCVPYLSFRQRKYAVQGCIGIAVVMHLLVWFMKSAIRDTIHTDHTSIIGLPYGPIFPACLSIANDPSEVHMVAMALILGGAIFPLMAGAIFDAKGISKLTNVTAGRRCHGMSLGLVSVPRPDAEGYSPETPSDFSIFNMGF